MNHTLLIERHGLKSQWGRETVRQRDSQTDRQTDRETVRQTDSQTDRQWDRQTVGQTNRGSEGGIERKKTLQFIQNRWPCVLRM